MIWLIGVLCFITGLCIGAVLFKQLMSDAAKVEQLEEKLSKLQSEHDHYKNSVHSHFSGTAQLVDKLVESSREVYRHLASGAHTLCPENISSQLSLSMQKSMQDRDLLSSSTSGTNSSSFDNEPTSTSLFPPRDYADKASSDQIGNLSEEYGLEKDPAENNEEQDKKDQNIS